MQKTLGLDFGHCEVAMSLTQDGKKPENLVLDGSKNKIIPSQIMLTEAQIEKLSGMDTWEKPALSQLGKIQIGNDAMPKNDEDSQSTTFLYFKKSPTHFQEIYEEKLPHGALMAAYVYQLVEQVLVYNPDYLEPGDRENIALVVGCPTTREWTSKENMAKYRKLISGATGIRNVSIVPESRAAMFSSIESALTCISAANGAVVFDFGSSTADCTYMLSGRRCIEYSWTLGAQEIERQMAKVALDGKKASLQSRIYVTSQLRTAKEHFYSGAFGSNGQRFFYDVYDIHGDAIEADIRVNDKLMDQVVNSEESELTILCDSKSILTGSWKKLCYCFFDSVKKLLQGENLPCENIVLTGGASKMNFVKEVCEYVFGTGVTIHVESTPSSSVANGLGWASAIDARVPQILVESKEKVLRNQEIKVRKLCENIAGDLQKMVAEIANRQAQLWAAEETDQPATKLVERITAEMECDGSKKAVGQLLARNIDNWKKNYASQVCSVVNENISKLMSKKIADGVSLPMGVWDELDKLIVDAGTSVLNHLDVKGILDHILESGRSWIYVVVGVYFGIPGILVIWAANKIMAKLTGKTTMTKPLNKKKREKICKDLNKAMLNKKITKQLVDEVYKQFQEVEKNYPAMTEAVLAAAYDVVTLKRFEHDTTHDALKDGVGA